MGLCQSRTTVGVGRMEKARRSESHGQDSAYFSGWEEYESNPYHPVANPSGIIQMGLAENQLSLDLLESWMAANPDATGFERDGMSVFRELALFQDYHGYPPLKEALAKFMGRMRGNRVHFAPENLVLTAGATSANEILMFCLTEPGDAFLVPTPYYPGFDRDLQWRTGTKIVPVRCSSANGFRITMLALEQAYAHAGRCGMRVSGVLVTNPSNPLGTAATRAELECLVRFTASRRIHLVSDEVYAGTVADPRAFTSALEVARAVAPEHAAERVHLVYSLSKDLGLPGFRAGAVYSTNVAVLAAATRMSSFGLVSAHAQHLLSRLLADEDFTERYMEESRRRLAARRATVVAGLREAGMECLEGAAGGLFCWVDMRRLLAAGEGERGLWAALLRRAGVNATPGAACGCGEEGWFRLCFANVDEETLEVAMRRIKIFVAETSEKGGKCRHRSRDCGCAEVTFTGRVFPLSTLA